MQLIGIVILSVISAIMYGVIHDQITVRICLEYFTVAHPQLIQSNSPTVIALFWGVIATWWAGGALGILLAIAARFGPRPKLAIPHLIRPLAYLLGGMFATAVLAGMLGFMLAKIGAIVLVEPYASTIPTEKHVAFLVAGWAHSASYLSGFAGGIALSIATWRKRNRLTTLP